ncbi:MAG TPA: sterol desaturase family protein [Rudaea sp.]|jgi:sterol desaturase/sphingolipid hydroxylase (fatty acid hydroxylase superfamily)
MASDTIGTETRDVAAAPEPSVATVQRPQRFWHAAQRRIAWLSTTRANARAGLVADILAGCALLAAGLMRSDNQPATSLATAVLGLVMFSFVEYCFHRWLFHGRVELFEQGHRKHHEQPLANDSLPFFAPPLVAFTLAWLLAAVMPTTTALLFTGGIAAGYAAYGLTHSVFHHVRFRRLFARRWAAAHHIHHCHPGSNFGVTTPLWDIVLRTRYRSTRPRSAQ